MKLGFFTMPVHPLDKERCRSLEEDRDAFNPADKLGFRGAYCGEHVADLAENITSSTTFLARIGQASRTIRLGTGMINMAHRHPAAAAAEIAMPDHMLDGRLNQGVGSGALLSDAEAFGTPVHAGKGWVDRKLARRSMILQAEKVAPLIDAAEAASGAAAQ